MKKYGIEIRKFDPWKKKGKNYVASGYSASQFRILEVTPEEPKIVTPEYIEYLIEKYQLQKAMIDNKIKKLKKMLRSP